jgi:succinate dehydrogenase hydrophobic anchor subunit
MLEFSKQYWRVFLSLFAVFLVGSIQPLIWLNGKWYQNWAFISLAFLALVTFVIAVIGLVYVIRDTRKKDKERKNRRPNIRWF